METINDLLSQVQAAPLALLLIVALNLVGWALKSYEAFPNKLIPIVLMVLGAIAMAFLGDPGTVNPSTRYPQGWLAVQGIIYAFIAWVLHGAIWKRFGLSDPAEEKK